jgi:hypothetical protein
MDDLIQDNIDMILKIHKIMEQNRDNSKMEIGDRVIPWDGSSLSGINGEKYYIKDKELSTKFFIVISNKEKTIVKPIENEYLQDLIIAHPETKQLFRISSTMVKHYITK